MSKLTFDIVREMISEFYKIDGNSCGGSLHIVTDDYNVDDEALAYCLDYAVEQNDDEAIKLAAVLMLFAPADRYKIVTFDDNAVIGD